MKTYIYLFSLVLILIIYIYAKTTAIIYDLKIYNIKHERKSLFNVNTDIVEIIEDVNNNQSLIKNEIDNLFPDLIVDYKNDYSRAKKASKYEYSYMTFNKLKKILNKHLTELNIIEKDMYIKSNNSTITSCESLDENTFYKAFNMINNINFMFNNTIDNYFFTHTIQYYEFLYDKYALLYRYINKNNIIKIGNIDTRLVSSHHEACEWVFKKYTNDKIPTIFHVDSHPDTNPCSNPKDLIYVKNNIHNNDSINKLYTDVLDNDIGSVIIPCLYPYKHDGGYFWLLPKWVNIPKNADKGANMYEVDEENSGEGVTIKWSDIMPNKPKKKILLKK